MNRFHFLAFPVFLILFICCKHKPKASTAQDEDPNKTEQRDSTEISDCLLEKMDTFKARYKDGRYMAQIFTFEDENGETFYFFDEGMAMDLPAYVLNNACDTICLTGGFRRGPISEDLPKCPEEKEGSRKLLWN